MSIYGTWITIADERQRAAAMKEAGINYGVIGELPDTAYDAPIIYQGSHVLPSDEDARGGSVSVSMIPDHIERDDHPQGAPGVQKNWLRLDVTEHSDTYGEQTLGDATVVLTRDQAERLADTLIAWLEREPDDYS